MRIECDNKYTYECDPSFKVKVGDTVVVGVMWYYRDVFGPTAERVVTSLHSDYTGDCERIISIKKRARKAKVCIQ